MLLVAAALFPFRRELAQVVLRAGAYIVWSLNILGQVIPQQVLWLFLLMVILYIAVGSFYGKRLRSGSSREDAPPITGQVEAVTRWIEEGPRGTYFKWRIANLLGGVHRAIEESASGGTSSRVPMPSPHVQSYLDTGLNTSYVDYPTGGMSRRRSPRVFDIPLEDVVTYLEEQMEIKHEQQDH